MKNKLEKKILNSIYILETKKTIINIIIKLLSLLGLVLIIWFFGLIVIDILNEQNTLELLDIFQENIEVVRNYLTEIGFTLYYEIPKLFLLILIVGVVGLTILVITIIKNFSRIKNKILSICRYWQQNK